MTCECVQNNGEILSGQWWRLITPAVLHLNPVHLGLNTLALNNVGSLLERESGAGRFLAVYTISAITSIAASCMQPRHSIGASGNMQVVKHAMLWHDATCRCA